MRLNKELVREVLLAVDASDKSPHSWIDVSSEGHKAEVVAYHVMLLDEAGLLVAQDLSSMSRFDWRPKRLTISGHEYLDTIRDDEVGASPRLELRKPEEQAWPSCLNSGKPMESRCSRIV